jgi:DNA-binding ferritin-like protein
MKTDLANKLFDVIKKSGFVKEQEEMDMEDDTEKETTGNDFSEMISKLNTSSIQVHIFHWQVKGKSSYAAHKAFGDYYEGIPDLIDGIVESYQGKYGIIENFTCEGVENFKDIQTCVDYFANLMEMIEEKRKSVEDSYLQNQIDTIVELITSTMYKLRFLH